MNSTTVKKIAQEIGFHACGITKPTPLKEAEEKLSSIQAPLYLVQEAKQKIQILKKMEESGLDSGAKQA